MSIRCPPFITITKKRKEKTEKVVLRHAFVPVGDIYELLVVYSLQ